ncbi:MAG: sigma-70 family RNA polymerase sigma factor [Acidobacteriota bacterium]|nr:sigma-70 family RNA polymerase sigma factor [Acidobacteriota bacterium]
MNLENVIQECLEGKAGAWNMLVDAYSRKIFNLAYQFSGSYQEAEDLTQEIFIKLYHSLGKYDAGKNFTAWLLTLGRNHLIDQYRRTRREKTQRDDFEEHRFKAGSSADPEESLIREETRKKVWDGLDGLPEDMRMALILRDIQGHSYEEMAESLDIPLGTVKSRVNRARLQLARLLRDRQGADHDL